MGDLSTWHKQITKHRLFEHLSKPDSQIVHPSLLAVSGAEIFLATASHVRYTDASCMRDYIELDIDGMDFEITTLTLNRTRSLLIIAGESKVLAIFLPRVLRQLQRRLKAYVIGDYSKGTVVQAEIHPYCSADTSVVILSSDGYLRLYEFNISFESPELVVDLLGESIRRTKSLYSLGDVGDMLPTRFCFGTDGDGWTAFTVFTLFNNGDVIAVCPLLPRTCLITDDHAKLFATHIADGGQQCSALATKIVQAIDRGDRGPLGVTFLRPTKLFAPTVLAPLLFAPAPLEFSKVEVAATGICFLPTQPLNVLSVACDGKVDVCAMAQSITPNPKEAVQVTVHESIVLPGTLGPRLLQNTFSATNSSFFILHNNGAHEVETKHWLNDIAQSFESQSDQQIRDAAREDISSEVTVLLDSQKLGLLGCATLENDLEYFLLGLSSDTSAQLLPLNDPSVLLPLEETTAHKSEKDTTSDSLIPSYQSLLTTPAYRPQNTAHGAKIVVPPGISHKQIKSDVETLQFMAKFVLQARKELEALMSNYIAMHRRLAVQNKEFSRQQKKVDSIKLSQDNFDSTLPSRIEQVKIRQDNLEKRLARISQELIDKHSPRLSDAERRYFQELDRVRVSLSGTRGLIARATIAENQFKQLRPLINATNKKDTLEDSVTGPRESPLRTTQLTSIKDRIQCNEDVLSKTKSKIERLSRLAAIS
ncbi:Nucleoporin Nup82 [Taphrina deformans PYCC 5710]|uniref:Nucleoporin Nup82 n=1 Tax=Taphrina deformans (strain PYCC 5710 / ATCC 11124 / CBS 356.35 / IMI 108563 / JCM 9778 / NBRC 8474) TaxID=1097556 RepID=R4XPK1_TAPDE|nr:Nucleoporin Nup82 [Taphrina deformans PYCC 5710]|eukprot:CCG85141.1 Nucleoporin Nup82 [Taphrina deformans PYCC 5710]